MDNYQKYIYISKYAKYLDTKQRRETWEETVSRYVNYWKDRHPELISEELSAEMFNAIYSLDVMPSMRALMTAGKALDRDNVAGFNCSAIAVNHQRCFDEIFYLLMCGCGVGFSVERQYINQLPSIPSEIHQSESKIIVRDSKIGWASALKELISMLYSGSCPTWDTSKVRPAGAKLKTFGGRASGPAPLESLFKYVAETFRKSSGRPLNSLECHDLVCKIADTVIVGSVRRSACISLSNLTDDRMRRAKTGEWWVTDPQRSLANNSVAYTEKPDMVAFSKEWRSMYKSRSGERGIVNKAALRKKAESCGRDYSGDYLLNPCAEAILRDSGGLCNLTEVCIRPSDSIKSIKRKVYFATLFGTLQSTLTEFRYLRKIWKDNAEDERLLGISLTGIMDNVLMSGNIKVSKLPNSAGMFFSLPDTLAELRQEARHTNELWSNKLGINTSKQLTLIKPSGTVSQLCNTSSGIHPRMFPYYIRRVTQDSKDPLTQLMIDQGVPHDVSGEKVLFKFPIKSPEGSLTSKDVDALTQLKLWKVYRDSWCEGNPSQTIYYTDDEFFDVGSWVWKNWDSIGGLSFFPKDDHVYTNAPYEEISGDEYNNLLAVFPEIDFSKLPEYEKEDSTVSSQTLSCSGGQCEI